MRRRTGFLGAAALLAVAGAAMLGIGFVMLSGDRAVGEGSASSLADTPPDSAVLTEVDNPVIGPAAGEPTPASEETTTSTLAPDVVPTRVLIPSIEVDAGVIDLGLNPDRTLEVPEDIGVTGWYTGRSVPGEVGPSVVVGHVDSAVAGAGVFFNLRDVESGDPIEIHRSDGSVAQFEVSGVILVDKDQFPTETVYGSTEEPTLRLITCGGSFDRGAGSYEGNVIVFARHLGNLAPLATPS